MHQSMHLDARICRPIPTALKFPNAPFAVYVT